MSDDNMSQKSWFEKISRALLREPKDREQLIRLLHDAKEKNLLDNEALNMIEGVLQMSQMQVRDVMIPRPQMVVIDEEHTPDQALPIIIKAGHSRFPVVANDRDTVLGVLLAKDLLKYAMQPATKTPIRMKELVRLATIVPESKRLDTLLKEFRQNRNHMAIVVDEYGSVAGLVTIEDVLEQIVGDIADEYDIDDTESMIKKIGDNRYSVKALTPIDDFNAFFNTDYSDEDYDTIGGLVLHRFSHVPKPGESITINPFKITIVHATSRGIQLMRLKVLDPKND